MADKLCSWEPHTRSAVLSPAGGLEQRPRQSFPWIPDDKVDVLFLVAQYGLAENCHESSIYGLWVYIPHSLVERNEVLYKGACRSHRRILGLEVGAWEASAFFEPQCIYHNRAI